VIGIIAVSSALPPRLLKASCGPVFLALDGATTLFGPREASGLGLLAS